MPHKEAMNTDLLLKQKAPENIPELKYLNYLSLVN